MKEFHKISGGEHFLDEGEGVSLDSPPPPLYNFITMTIDIISYSLMLILFHIGSHE